MAAPDPIPFTWNTWGGLTNTSHIGAVTTEGATAADITVWIRHRPREALLGLPGTLTLTGVALHDSTDGRPTPHLNILAGIADALTHNHVARFLQEFLRTEDRLSRLLPAELAHTALTLPRPARQVGIALLLHRYDGTPDELRRLATAATTQDPT